MLSPLHQLFFSRVAGSNPVRLPGRKLIIGRQHVLVNDVITAASGNSMLAKTEAGKYQQILITFSTAGQYLAETTARGVIAL